MAPRIEATDSDDDNDLPLSLIHARDTILIDGEIDQDYRFLVYRFANSTGEVSARTYFDDPWEVAIVSPLVGVAVDTQVMRYLQRRFDVIKQLGGPDGYVTIWRRESGGNGGFVGGS